MPSVSRKQQRFFGAELARARAGQRTRTGLSIAKLREFAKGPLAKTLRAHHNTRHR